VLAILEESESNSQSLTPVGMVPTSSENNVFGLPFEITPGTSHGHSRRLQSKNAVAEQSAFFDHFHMCPQIEQEEGISLLVESPAGNGILTPNCLPENNE